MSTTLQNIFIILGAVLLLGLAYILFFNQNSLELSPDAVNPLADQMLVETQIFIERRAALDRVDISSSLFTDSRFTSLRSYSPTIAPQTVGKSSLFTMPPELQVSSSE